MALSGQCYCGKVRLTGRAAPQVVAYCHCNDCRRWTGAPLPAFAGLGVDTLDITPAIAEVTHPSGAIRRNCPDCGSPLAVWFPYLPDQVYVPLGLLDQIADHPPQLHCHADAAAHWLHDQGNLPRVSDSGRAQLSGGFDE